jgi:enoyl-CoA hydratase/3-hydroxyacyl-CoA dehydrogenase
MPYTLAGRTVQRVAVVGSGNVGPDIALFLARALHRHGVPVVLHDISEEALRRGRERILAKLRAGGESGIYRPLEVEALEKSLSFTLDRSLLVGCCFIVEAATENLEAKRALFEDLERVVAPHAILASNSSHLEPDRIFERLRRPERALVHHYFFPADRNPLVEIVPASRTQVADWCQSFYESLGKIPIRARGRWGYAVNPVFEGIQLAALEIEKAGMPPAVIDAIACRALRARMGPFGILDQSGRNAVLRVGLEGAHEKIMPWFRVPASLEKRLAEGGSWGAADRGATVSYSDRMFQEISRMLLGAYFGLACEVVESGVAELSELELGVEVGLDLHPPFSLMNELGPERVRSLVETYARAHPGFRIPAAFGPWTIPVVQRRDRDGVAVLTLRRPRTLNAVNPEVFRQLGRHLEAVKHDPAVRGVVLTGFGTKAFSSGADLASLREPRTPEESLKVIRDCQRTTRQLETLGKPSVAALNGLSLGAGSELAYACGVRIARRGMPVAFGQPEVKLGLIPGAGATQRLPRLVGFDAAWRLLRTGGTLSGAEALRLGLIREEVDGPVVDRAVALALELDPAPPPPACRVPSVVPDVDLQGLSRRIDEILRRALLEGAGLDLDAGLELEARCFAEAYQTQDHRIGIENYLKHQFKQPARFVHQ